MLETYSAIGTRLHQEDACLAIEENRAIFLAVADGFSKDHESGHAISQRVIATLSDHLETLSREILDNSKLALEILFATIARETAEKIAGSTLSLACILPEQGLAHVAVLGDSPIALLQADNSIRIMPDHHIHLGGNKLWGCFGDRHNKRSHTTHPEINSFSIARHGVVLVSSDGFYPSHDPKIINALAEEYMHFAQKGEPITDLAARAFANGSEDNVTLSLWRA